MAPKRKERESLESLLARPWCYYCDRDFDDLKILHDHQKAKHFHCIVGTCNRRLNTAGGLRVHMEQVHKENLEVVPNALVDRQGLTPEVFGMEGVPQSMLDQRTSLVIKEYNKIESEWRARTGNPLSGTAAAKEEAEQARKKQKVAVDKEELKRRAAAAKAARAAKKAGLEPPKQFAPGIDEMEQPEPVSFAQMAAWKAADAQAAASTPPAPSVSPYAAPPFKPMNGAAALPTPFSAPVAASPYQTPPSISPPGFPMGMYPPPGMPMGMPAYSPSPVSGYGAPPPGLPQRVNMPLPGMSGLPSIPGLPPRPTPVAPNGSTNGNVEELINTEYEKFLERERRGEKASFADLVATQAKYGMVIESLPDSNGVMAPVYADNPPGSRWYSNPKVEAGAKLTYSDNFLTPEEKKSASPRYRRGAKASTTQTFGHTQAASGAVYS
ncbi:BUB3-interacting and GLEBS motif-containing protein [Fulvia fulva]|uniref:BUB3-interacting and GLEBS motif-containing protein n=1 Tax=Passalora fulva TaxID=5499 RepID=A0A9Q8LIB8_PASFU|nr:BUB3-interacting and GLEBS motif-containing protein [Fulvia fulva]KAK4627283.1 BUB3-interacting and GLEBS motif-containing protein [Fulvia fulva]KAK4628102.1 BUB3-interacting and GLEBS motif-containing protein [Fulvia fulva]UJO17138.1 BUB3-interacting and GLEBS motif-containing protein [Fulvia fulva]WPV13668.1 BUB3-interacting and GLEBS motif-containing protein [Fulvia fulva]